MQPARHNDTFIREAEELLEQIEGAALALETAPSDTEQVHLLFRAFHTLKGASGMVGLSAIASFTHHVETTLDRVRAGKLGVTQALIDAILESRDYIQALLQATVSGEPLAPLGADELVRRLVAFRSDSPGAIAAPAAMPRLRTTFHVTFRLKRELDGLTLEPKDLLSSLEQLGVVEAQQVGPANDGFYPSWELSLRTESSEDAVRDVFIFAPFGSELQIERGLAEFVTEPPPAAAPALPVARVSQASRSAITTGGEPVKLEVRKADVVKVASERLDKLVKLVGELVINQSRLQQAYASGVAAELAGPVESMDRLIAELRDSVFGMRMMPIGPTFARFKRLVRDLSAQLGKNVELMTEGEDTELDKTVLDQLADPLVHLIRNSLDHGIELPEERLAKGKAPRGTLYLGAAHESGVVAITIRDDGRGLNRAAIRQKAEERGLIEPGAHLSEQETYELIMRPGFSTAQAVTELSGRGVGMDVVKKTVEGLRGSLSISSTPEQGTTMRLTLPLTLAIIDGLMVMVGGEHFIVPMAAVTENVELYARTSRPTAQSAVAVRGELVLYLLLRDLFGTPGNAPSLERVVIVTIEGQRVGLVVDSVVGSHQTVIQPLGPFYRDVELFSGTTIMGDGRVVMILDLVGTLRRAERRRTAALARTETAEARAASRLSAAS